MYEFNKELNDNYSEKFSELYQYFDSKEFNLMKIELKTKILIKFNKMIGKLINKNIIMLVFDEMFDYKKTIH